MEWRQSFRNQRGVLQARDANCEVKTFFHQIDKAIIEPHIENNVRVCETEINQRLPDNRVSKGAGGRKLYASACIGAGFADGILKRVNLANDLDGAVIIGVTGFGERKLARRAVEKACTKFVFQFAHIFGKQRL